MADQDLAVALEQLRTEVRTGFARLEERMESLTKQATSSDNTVEKLEARVSVMERKIYAVSALVGMVSMFLPEGVRAAIGA